MEQQIDAIAHVIVEHSPCVALTGAGISAESGIPTFRAKGGMWEKYDPAVYASIEVFRQDPAKYWAIRGEFIYNYDHYQPNPAHTGLFDLEQMGLLPVVITQNIDGLHKKAGSQNVIELHGSLRETYCQRCRKRFVAPHVPQGRPPRCECGGVLKPNTVLFGESLPAEALEAAYGWAQKCRSMLVVGTSAVVQPAASLPVIAQNHGAVIVEINPERAFAQADYHLAAKAGQVLPLLTAAIDDWYTAKGGRTP